MGMSVLSMLCCSASRLTRGPIITFRPIRMPPAAPMYAKAPMLELSPISKPTPSCGDVVADAHPIGRKRLYLRVVFCYEAAPDAQQARVSDGHMLADEQQSINMPDPEAPPCASQERDCHHPEHREQRRSRHPFVNAIVRISLDGPHQLYDERAHLFVSSSASRQRARHTLTGAFSTAAARERALP